jgi:hypothetical protein
VATEVRAGREPAEILASKAFAPFASWDNNERLAVNAALIKRGGSGRVSSRERLRLIAKMGALRA